MKKALPTFGLVLLLVMVTISCHRSSRTASSKALTGNVAVAGKPVEKGKLYLEPKGGGVQCAIEVEGGHYTLNPEAGTLVGPYIARVIVVPSPGETSGFGPIPVNMKKNAEPTELSPQEYTVDIVIPAGATRFDITFPGKQ